MSKILLIDDDDALRQLYRVELSSRGHEIIEAANGEEGLTKAQNDQPNIILLDVMMPKLDGIATLTRLKENAATQKIPVIMLTNFGQENLVKQAFDLGSTDYLLKYKVTPAEMSEKVAQALAATPA